MPLNIPTPPSWRRAPRPPGQKFGEILTDIAEDDSRERVSVADLLEAMGDRAFGPLLFVFALPNILPAPPGTSAVLGLPLIFLSGQLMLSKAPWLPKLIADRSMKREDFGSIVGRATPWLAKAEKLLRPRLGRLVDAPAEYLIGAMCLMMAVVLALPIPFVNMLPAFTISLFALGVLERDGVWILAGVVVWLISSILAVILGYALFKTAILLFTNAFG